MRQWAVFLCAALVLAACGGGGGSSVASPTRACPLFRELDAIATSVEDIDVSDPDAFEQQMADAVEEFSEVISELRETLPETLVDDIDAYEAAVMQYDFDEARATRAPLDQFAETECTSPTTATTGT